MLFKIDENLPIEEPALLRRYGHDATTVFDEALQGSPDTLIAEVCRREQRALITLDLDFADIRAYPPESSSGSIVLRLTQLDKSHVLAALERIVSIFERETLRGRLWIVDEARVRNRGAEAPVQEDDEN
jgi:predicted nuclease of predicted toxin-antitoxin system